MVAETLSYLKMEKQTIVNSKCEYLVSVFVMLLVSGHMYFDLNVIY